MTTNGSINDDDEEEPMPREENRTAEDWARYAAKKAEHAADHALDAHAAVGRLAGDVGRLTTEVRAGFDSLRGTVREHQRSLHDLAGVVADDPEDNTQIRNLKAVVKTLDDERTTAVKRKEFWVKFAASAVSAGIAVAIGSLLLRWLHL